MTELIGFAALAVGGYWIANRIKKKMSQVERQLSEAARASHSAQPAETLVLDPETGKYRPQ